MKRRRFLQRGAVTTAALALGSRLWAAPAFIRRKPVNVLMLVTSQEQPWDRLPAQIALPARERLAHSARHFTQYLAGGTLTTPARAALYTGQHWQFSGLNNDLTAGGERLSPDLPTLGHMFQSLGYHTAYRGKWQLSPVHHRSAAKNRVALQPYGFDSYSEKWDTKGPQEGHRRDPQVATDAAAFIATQRGSEKPWFLAANLHNPADIGFFHLPSFGDAGVMYSAGVPDDPLYRRRHDIRFPANFGMAASSSGEPSNHQRSRELMSLFFGDIPTSNEAAWREICNYYLNCLLDSDRAIATILDALEASGEAGNTVVVLTSDHGEMLGAHGMRDKGANFFREVVSPPLLIAHPDVANGGRSSELVSAIDIAPTLLAMAGIDTAERATRFPQLRGRDVSVVVANGNAAGPRRDSGVLFNQGNTMFMDVVQAKKMTKLMKLFPMPDYNPDKPPRMPPKFLTSIFSPPKPDMSLRGVALGVCDGRYKFARYFAPEDPHIPASIEQLRERNDLELYDMSNDPWELNNLASLVENAQLLMTLSNKTQQLVSREIDGNSESI